MRFERILALVIAIACVVAAVGNWIGAPPQQVISPASPAGGKADVALLEVYGQIADSATGGGPFSSTTGTNANTLIQQIRQARKDDVKAILLLINSPGGTAAASQAIYDELMRVRKETNTKIVAALGDVAASGGYFVASAAHHIVANPASVTGSIGVIVRTQNVSPLLDRLGVKSSSIQSGPYKDILSPFRETTSPEREIIQAVVTESYQQFLNAIVAGRGISLAQLRPLADGRIFTGSQAQKVKLVDSLGNVHTALDKTAELAKIQGEPNVRNYSAANLWQSFFPSFESLIPGYQQVQQARWHKIPLALME